MLEGKLWYAIDGKSWCALETDFPNLLPYVVSNGLVFGRMLPEQKVKLVEHFQNMGYVTAMCGDGANDAGVSLARKSRFDRYTKGGPLIKRRLVVKTTTTTTSL